MKLFCLRIQIAFCLLLLLGVVSLRAQTSPRWLTPMGVDLNSFIFDIAPAPGNGWVAAGGIQFVKTGGSSYWLVRVDSNGSALWQQFVNTADEDAALVSIAPASNGYITGGVVQDSVFDGWHESDSTPYDAALLRFDDTGGLVWGHAYGGSANDHLVQVISTHDGGYAFVGTTSSSDGDILDYKNPGSNPSDVWIEKVDSVGGIEWERTFGGSGVDLGIGIAELPDHSFGVIANTHSGDGDVSHNFGSYDIWVLRLDSAGNKLWDQSFGSSLDDAATGIAATKEGTMLIAGQRNFRDSGGSELAALWAAKLDTNGNILWQLDDTEWRGYLPSTMSETASGGVLIAGGIPHTQEPSTPFAAEFRSDGTLAWRDSISIVTPSIPFIDPNLNAIAPARGGFVLVGTGGFDTIPIEAFVGRFTTGSLGVTGVRRAETECQVFPTPAPSSLNIRLPSAASGHGILYNSLGEAALRFQIAGGAARLDVSRLPRGIYYVQASAAGKEVSVPVVVGGD